MGIGAVKLAGALKNVGSELFEMAKAGPGLRNIEAAFGGIADNAEDTLRRLRVGSLGLVRDIDLMTSYNKAAQLVGVTFAEQLPEAMQYLGKVAASTGQDIGFLLDSLVTGVGRESKMILDNLGIMIDITAATDAYAESLGKTSGELTNAERKAAIMNEVLAQLATNTVDMPDLEVSGWDQMSTTIQNLRDDLAISLAPAMAKLSEPLAAFAADMAPKIGEAVDGIITKLLELSEGNFSLNLIEMLGGEDMGGELRAWIEENFGADTNWIQVFKDALRTIEEAWAGTWTPNDGQGVEALPIHNLVGEITLKFKEMIDGILLYLKDPRVQLAIVAISTLLFGLLNPIGGILLAIGWLALAWATNWNGMRDKLNEIHDNIVEWLQAMGFEIESLWDATVTYLTIMRRMWDITFADIRGFIEGVIGAIQSLYGWYLKVLEVAGLYESKFGGKGGAQGDGGGGGSGGFTVPGADDPAPANLSDPKGFQSNSNVLFAAGSIVIQGNASQGAVKQGVQDALRASGLA